MAGVKGRSGGVRPGQGRPKGSKNKTVKESNARPQHQLRAHAEEWELIRAFAKVVKEDIAKAKSVLENCEK